MTEDTDEVAGARPTASPEDLAEIRARIETIAEETAALRDAGAEHDIPAVERTAKRLQGTLSTLEANVPPEVVEEAED